MKQNIKQKSVLISGGSRGIGAEIVRAFAADGWRVAFIYNRSEESAAELARETGAAAIKCDLRGAGPDAGAGEETGGLGAGGVCREDFGRGGCGGAMQREQIATAVMEAKTLLGVSGFDALVCNAGAAKISLCTDVTPKEWEELLAVNLSASFFLIQETLPAMISAKSGAIVTVSSMWGQVGASCEVAYSATKAGLIGMTKALAKEVGPSGVRVNCVAPGVVDTDMNRELDQQAKESLCEEIPLGRIAEAKEIAGTIKFLCSDDASYITGQVLGVNGGLVM